ncbi:MAG: tRNA (adenosine(37)-N6)-dimethylallyltransferase MiaA, partial [Treponema sp.]|nr:tRNA (adenosine(37)-N6)-dimethylallyltransferase MiaA [Treponema sp.]
DPPSAGRIHIHDEYRLLRALEVYRLSGRPLSGYRRFGRGPQDRFRFLIIGLERPREELYRRINERSAAMFRSGLPAEAEALWKKGYSPRDPGLRAIGYREFFIEDSPGTYRFARDAASVEALTAQNSRRYAKRQITYFASLPGVKWMSADDPEGIRTELQNFLRGGG